MAATRWCISPRPVSLRSVLDEAGEVLPERFARKMARVLRTHFRRIRAAVIGPDLSHRRTVVDAVLNAEPVRAAITATAVKENISYAKSWQQRAQDDDGNCRRLFASRGAFGVVPAAQLLEQAVRRHHHASLRQGPRRRARL